MGKYDNIFFVETINPIVPGAVMVVIVWYW